MEVKSVALMIMMLFTLLHCGASLPLSKVEAINITPDNVRYLASFLDGSVDIQDRVIHFGPGTASEMLLEVPLGEINPRSTVIITVGLDKSHPNTVGTDSDIVVGISDGTNDNVHQIHDINNYDNLPPCRPESGSHDNTLLSPGTQVPGIVKLMFTPYYQYTACETAQEGGYINTGKFNTQIDATKPLFLRYYRNGADENTFIHFLKVEIY